MPISSELLDGVAKSLRDPIASAISSHLRGLSQHIATTMNLNLKDVEAAIDSYGMKKGAFEDVQPPPLTLPPLPPQQKLKFPEQKGQITIMLHYSEKCHAFFGDTTTFKEILKKNGCLFNKFLEYGPGWITKYDNLSVVVEALKAGKVNFSQIEKSDFVSGKSEVKSESKEGETRPPKKVKIQPQVEDGESSPPSKKTAPPPKSKKAPGGVPLPKSGPPPKKVKIQLPLPIDDEPDIPDE